MERYRVFGRTEYAEPLEFRGTVSAADQEAASAEVLRRLGGGWVELVLLPERSIHWVLREEAAEGGGG